MKEFEKIELDKIKDLRIECGLKDDENLNSSLDLWKYLNYKEGLNELIDHYDNLIEKTKDKLDNFDPRSLYRREDRITGKELSDYARGIRSMFIDDIKRYDEYLEELYDELNSAEEHISKIKNIKKKNKI